MPASFAGLVVLGGPMGVHDTDGHPWLAAERALIGAVARTGRRCSGCASGPSSWPSPSGPR